MSTGHKVGGRADIIAGILGGGEGVIRFSWAIAGVQIELRVDERLPLLCCHLSVFFIHYTSIQSTERKESSAGRNENYFLTYTTYFARNGGRLHHRLKCSKHE